MRYVLGFDGGGTKTDSVLMDETGVILARARSGSSNPTTFGVEASLTALSAAAREALRAAERSEQDIAYLVAGVSGAGEPAMHLAVQSGLQPRFPNAKICITSDLVLSVAAKERTRSLVMQIFAFGNLGCRPDCTAKCMAGSPAPETPATRYVISCSDLSAARSASLAAAESAVSVASTPKVVGLDDPERARASITPVSSIRTLSVFVPPPSNPKT